MCSENYLEAHYRVFWPQLDSISSASQREADAQFKCLDIEIVKSEAEFAKTLEAQ